MCVCVGRPLSLPLCAHGHGYARVPLPVTAHVAGDFVGLALLHGEDDGFVLLLRHDLLEQRVQSLVLLVRRADVDDLPRPHQRTCEHAC